MYKIKYKVNMLPQIGIHFVKDEVSGERKTFNDGISFMSLCRATEEIEVFLAAGVSEVIDYKWNAIGFNFHLIGCMAHGFYIAVLILYINLVYVSGGDSETHAHDSDKPEQFDQSYSILLAIGSLYPMIYDVTQMLKTGLVEYMSDMWNFMGFLYLVSSTQQIAYHMILGPNDIKSKISMTAVILLSMVKTLFYLRIFTKLSPIIKMLTSVIKDLQPFMLFFFVLLIKFSLIIGIMGLGNKNSQDGEFGK